MVRGLRLFHPAVAALALWSAVLTHPATAAETEDSLAPLFRQLIQPQDESWIEAEMQIVDAWSRTGSAALDLIQMRGEGALDEGDYAAAIGHLSALTDHAPDHAMGYHLRGTAFYLNGQVGLAAADFARALSLEPRQYLSLTQLGIMLEEMGRTEAAIDALHRSLEIHPNQDDARDALHRLARSATGTQI